MFKDYKKHTRTVNIVIKIRTLEMIRKKCIQIT